MVGLGVPGFDAYGLGQVFNGLVPVLFLSVGIAAVVVRQGIIALEPDGFREVGNRLVKITLTYANDAAVVERLGGRNWARASNAR